MYPVALVYTYLVNFDYENLLESVTETYQ